MGVTALYLDRLPSGATLWSSDSREYPKEGNAVHLGTLFEAGILDDLCQSTGWAPPREASTMVMDSPTTKNLQRGGTSKLDKFSSKMFATTLLATNFIELAE